MTFSQVVDRKFFQSWNKNLVLNTIYHQGSISRVEISKKTKLSQSTVTNIVDALKKDDYILEVGTGKSTKVGGRKPTILTVNSNRGYIIGVAIITEAFHTTLQICLFDLNLKLITEKESLIKEKGIELIEKIKFFIKEFIENHSEISIVGLGLSIPTVLDRRGVIFRGHLLELENYPLAQEMRKELPSLNLIIEQEQHAALIGERSTGSAKDVENLIYITVGRGIGSSVVVNNKLIRGEYGAAGEIGHMSINKYGKKCICGKNGCLRLYATELSFIEKIKEAIEEGVPIPDTIYNRVINKTNILEVYKEALKGDSFCRSMLTSHLDDLCIALSNLIYIFNPKMIVVGGNILIAGEFALPYIKDKLQQIMDYSSAEVEVTAANLGQKSSVYGVATMIRDKYFLNKEMLGDLVGKSSN